MQVANGLIIDLFATKGIMRVDPVTKKMLLFGNEVKFKSTDTSAATKGLLYGYKIYKEVLY